MGYIDDNEAMRDQETVTHLEKFNIMRAKYPHLYMHYKIFAHILDMGKGISKLENRDLLIEFVHSKKNPKSDKEYRDALAVHFEILIKDKVKSIAVSALKEAKEGKEIDHKEILGQMQQEGLSVAKRSLKFFLIEEFKEKEGQKERISVLVEKYEPNLKVLVGDIINNGTKAVHNWQNTKKSIKRGRIQQESIRRKISDIFDLNYDVWMKSCNSVQDFEKIVDQYKKPTKNNDPLDDLVIGDIDRMPVAEEDELYFLLQSLPIEVPGDIESFSPEFLFKLVEYLKINSQIDDALYVIDILLKSREPFKYKYKNTIMHHKAIFLSHDSIKNWDDAIDILLDLYSASRYHFHEPEIVTLLASNYKRKALYNTQGDFNKPEDVNLDLLAKSLSLYYEAYELKENQEKYYDAVNIAYLTLILHNLEEETEDKKSFSEIKQEVSQLHHDLQKVWQIDENDWWQIASSIEFYLLQGNSLGVELEYDKAPQPEPFEADATLRQLMLYMHFCPNDTQVNEFLNFFQSQVSAQ